MALILRLIAFALLAFVAGGAAMYFGTFGGKQMANAFLALKALQVQQAETRSSFNRQAIFPVEPGNSGVTRFKPELAYSGFTLYAEGLGQTVRLIDMEGNVVHTWTLSYHDMWDDSQVVQNLVPEKFVFVRKAEMYPDGRLLVSFSARASTPHGYGIAMVDKDSKLLWKDFRHIHHSFDEAEDGTLYALDHVIATEAHAYFSDIPTPYMEEGIAVYSRDGKHLSRISLLDSFQNSEYADVIPVLALKNVQDGSGELMHSNDIDVLPSSLADKFPFAEAGDLLVSLRDVDGIAIIDPKTQSVKWFRRGYWHRQHDADFLDNGNMLIFDNVAMKRDVNNRQASRIIEFDPKTMEVVWEYRSVDNDEFYSFARASQQRLANGNTLITESHRLRLLEVTSDGEIVWEFFNPVRIDEENRLSPALFFATRYPTDYLLFEPNG